MLRLRNDSNDAIQVTLRFDGGVRKPPPSEVIENYVAEVGFVDHYLGRLRQRVEDLPVLYELAEEAGGPDEVAEADAELSSLQADVERLIERWAKVEEKAAAAKPNLHGQF